MQTGVLRYGVKVLRLWELTYVQLCQERQDVWGQLSAQADSCSPLRAIVTSSQRILHRVEAETSHRGCPLHHPSIQLAIQSTWPRLPPSPPLITLYTWHASSDTKGQLNLPIPTCGIRWHGHCSFVTCKRHGNTLTGQSEFGDTSERGALPLRAGVSR